MRRLRDVWDVARWGVAGAGRSDHEVTWREGLLYGYAWPTYWGWRWELREPEGALVAGMSARTWCGVKLAAKRAAGQWCKGELAGADPRLEVVRPFLRDYEEARDLLAKLDELGADA